MAQDNKQDREPQAPEKTEGDDPHHFSKRVIGFIFAFLAAFGVAALLLGK